MNVIEDKAFSVRLHDRTGVKVFGNGGAKVVSNKRGKGEKFGPGWCDVDESERSSDMPFVVVGS